MMLTTKRARSVAPVVNGEAMVICGNVQTANATVYLIDQVLLPAS